MRKINLDTFVKETNLTQATDEAMHAINGGCIYGVGYKCGQYVLDYRYQMCQYSVIHKQVILLCADGVGIYKAEEVPVDSGTRTGITKIY